MSNGPATDSPPLCELRHVSHDFPQPHGPPRRVLDAIDLAVRPNEIVVRDEGSGIPTDSVDRLFDKFYRADDGDRRRAGTGLGLAIAKGFVEVQGGTIAALR